MLSRADAELTRRDPALPGLALLLDPSALTRRLRSELGGARVGGVVATDVRYKPGTSCLVSYLLDLDGESRFGYAKAYGPAAPVKVAKRREQGPSRLVLDDLAVVVHFFPDDHRLRSLRRLEHPRTRRRLLARLAPDHPDLWDGQSLALRYKPERRYVARLRTPTRESAALRLYADAEFGQACSTARAFSSADELVVPRLLGSSDRFRALLLEWLPGRSLADVVAEPRLDPSAAAQVGIALALLHEQDAGRIARPAPLTEEAAVRTAARGLAAVLPSLGHRADELGRRLVARLARLPTLQSPIHGDFSADQVLLAADTAAILDLDRAGLGQPAADLGSFVASLERDVLGGTLERRRMEAFAGELIESYSGRSGRSSLPVELYAVAALLRLAVEPFRGREPDWPERAELLLARAEEVESRSRALRRPRRASAPPLAEFERLTLAARQLESMGLPGGPLRLRRAWPRTASHLVLEYVTNGQVVAGQWLADTARRAELAHATGLPVAHADPDSATVLLHVGGTDRRLPGLAPLLGTPGATLVSHRAERRAVVRLEDESEPRYAKVVRPDRLESVVAAGLGAERLGGADFAAPSLLAVDRAAGVSVWTALPGPTLYELANAHTLVSAAHAAGAALRSLHASTHPLPARPHPPEEEARWLGVWLDRLGHFVPGLAMKARRLARSAMAELIADESASVLLHRDFHDKQVVLHPDGRVGLLDFDTAATGEAALDVANLLAHLDLRTLQGRLSANRARRAAAAFLDGYDPPTEVVRRCAAYTDASRLRLACIYAFRPNSIPVSRALLERVGEPPLALEKSDGVTSLQGFVRESSSSSHRHLR